ncbi:MAG: hypothetical protein KatS3mg110_3832 [Pirellulaceae bacterium]|nr:MAG: hypothetical protein KatS3mg110_3832 [Pirellulaceae bacterium]
MGNFSGRGIRFQGQQQPPLRLAPRRVLFELLLRGSSIFYKPTFSPHTGQHLTKLFPQIGICHPRPVHRWQGDLWHLQISQTVEDAVSATSGFHDSVFGGGVGGIDWRMRLSEELEDHAVVPTH